MTATRAGIDVSAMTSELAEGTICCFFQDEVGEHLVFNRAHGRFQGFAFRLGSDMHSDTMVRKFETKASFLTDMVLGRDVKESIVMSSSGGTEREEEVTYRVEVNERTLVFLLHKGCVD